MTGPLDQFEVLKVYCLNSDLSFLPDERGEIKSLGKIFILSQFKIASTPILNFSLRSDPIPLAILKWLKKFSPNFRFHPLHCTDWPCSEAAWDISGIWWSCEWVESVPYWEAGVQNGQLQVHSRTHGGSFISSMTRQKKHENVEIHYIHG